MTIELTDYHKLAISFIVCIILIFSYGSFRGHNPEYVDPLMKSVGIEGMDGWSVTHFMFYAILGYYFPNYWREVLIAGIAWEVFEGAYGKYRPDWMGGFKDGNINITDGEPWWYARYSDIAVNCVGFIIGSLYAKNILN